MKVIILALLLSAFSAFSAFGDSVAYPPTPTAAELAARVRAVEGETVYAGGGVVGVELRSLDSFPEQEDPVVVLQEKKPFRDFSVYPAVTDPVVVLQEKKPFRDFSVYPAVTAPTQFDLKLEFTWAPPKNKFMKNLLRDVLAAKEAGDLALYSKLSAQYATWADQFLAAP